MCKKYQTNYTKAIEELKSKKNRISQLENDCQSMKSNYDLFKEDHDNKMNEYNTALSRLNDKIVYLDTQENKLESNIISKIKMNNNNESNENYNII